MPKIYASPAQSVTVCDPNKVYMRDLGSNFLSKRMLEPRVVVTSKLDRLNGIVTVKSIPVLTEALEK